MISIINKAKDTVKGSEEEHQAKVTEETSKDSPPGKKEKFSLSTYVKDSYKELKKVTWPTRPEALRSTGTVIIFSLMIAAFLGILDFFFNKGLDYIISIQ